MTNASCLEKYLLRNEWHQPTKNEKQATRTLTYVPKDREEMVGPEAI